jgi:hypothetical protein
MEFLRRLFRRKPPRVYLGQVMVAPRTDFLRHFEGGFKATQDSDLRSYFTDWLRLPSAPTPEMASDSDLAMDVLLKRYRLGEAITGDWIPLLFWRPMVEISSRTYFVKSGKDFATIEVRHKMPWRPYLNRVLSSRFWFFPVPAASKEDMHLLLGEALQEVVGRLRAKL